MPDVWQGINFGMTRSLALADIWHGIEGIGHD